MDKVYINVKFIYQMFTRWRFRLATEFVMCTVVLSGQWTFDRKAAKETDDFHVWAFFQILFRREKPFNPGRQPAIFRNNRRQKNSSF